MYSHNYFFLCFNMFIFPPAFGNLLKSLWKDVSETYISPNAFKTQIQKFAPRFVGYALVLHSTCKNASQK